MCIKTSRVTRPIAFAACAGTFISNINSLLLLGMDAVRRCFLELAWSSLYSRLYLQVFARHCAAACRAVRGHSTTEQIFAKDDNKYTRVIYKSILNPAVRHGRLVCRCVRRSVSYGRATVPRSVESQESMCVFSHFLFVRSN
jgi:hypothetical protein